MATKLKLTKRIVEQTPAPAEGRLEIRDTEMPGLVLRISSAGSRTWCYYFRDADGIERKPKLGDYPKLSLDEAREEARTYGKEKPVELKYALTLKELMELYKEKKLDPRAQPGTLRNFNRYVRLLGDFGKKSVGSISRADMVNFHDELAERTTDLTAAQVVGYISSVWDWGLIREKCPVANPAAKIEKARANRRKRTMEAEEQAAILKVMHEMRCDPSTRWYTHAALCVLQLIYETGVRASAVCALARADVEPEGTQNRMLVFWDKALPMAGHKDRIEHAVTEQVAAILAKAPPSDTPYVFKGKRSNHISYIKVWHLWQEIRVAAGVPDARIHDFRRSWVTDGVMVAGKDLTLVSKTLGHKKAATTAGYFEPRRAARFQTEQEIANARANALKAVS